MQMPPKRLIPLVKLAREFCEWLIAAAPQAGYEKGREALADS